MNYISMNDPERIVTFSKKLLNINRSWKSPFGSPGASKKIVNILQKILIKNHL